MKESDLSFFNPWGEIEVSKNRLPHWQQTGAVYFVTWRLVDSIPKVKLDQHYEDVAAWKSRHPEPWDEETEQEFHASFAGEIDRWLDSGHGSCLLRKRENSKIVEQAILHFEGERISVFSSVVMPNHVHVLFALNLEWQLEQIVHSWKSFSAKSINRNEDQAGRFWQKDYFDRLIRDSDHYRNCVRYIRSNPIKASLMEGEYRLWESDMAKEVATSKFG